MLDIYTNYCNPDGCNGVPAVARFLTIYIEEAHARDEWWLPESPEAFVGGKACIWNHKTVEERIATARKFQQDFNFPCELVCDSFDEDVNDKYGAWPERLYIIQDGVVVYQGGHGPFDYKLAEVKDWLTERFGLRGAVMTRR